MKIMLVWLALFAWATSDRRALADDDFASTSADSGLQEEVGDDSWFFGSTSSNTTFDPVDTLGNQPSSPSFTLDLSTDSPAPGTGPEITIPADSSLWSAPESDLYAVAAEAVQSSDLPSDAKLSASRGLSDTQAAMQAGNGRAFGDGSPAGGGVNRELAYGSPGFDGTPVNEVPGLTQWDMSGYEQVQPMDFSVGRPEPGNESMTGAKILNNEWGEPSLPLIPVDKSGWVKADTPFNDTPELTQPPAPLHPAVQYVPVNPDGKVHSTE